MRNRQAHAARTAGERLDVGTWRNHVLNQRATGLLKECQLAVFFIQTDLDQIAKADLTSRHQIRQRVDEEPFDRAFQMTSAVFVIDAFLQQHVFRVV